MDNIFSVSISTSVIIVLLILARPLLSKFYKAKLRYYIWLFVAVRLLLPFHPMPFFAVVNIPAVPDTGVYPVSQQSQLSTQPEVLPADEPVQLLPQAADTAAVSLHQLIILIWGTGAVAFLLYHMVWYLIFKRKISAWSNVIDNQKPQIATCKKIVSPMLFGIAKPVILLPDAAYSPEDLQMVLAHERAHYQRKDIWYKLLLLLSNAVHWFNPIVYLMVRYANKDLEFSCDEMVIENRDIAFRKAYSQSILNAVRTEKCSAFSTYFKGGAKDMKARFSNILKNEKKKRGILVLVVAVLATLLSGMLIACNQSEQQDAFGFLSAQWGSTWDEVQRDTGLAGEIREEGHRQLAQLENVEYLGVTGMAVFQFDSEMENDYSGLYSVMFGYQDADEEKIIAELENIHGARKTSYTDKNGVENPIGFSGGWVSEETVEGSLTEAEKERYIQMMGDIEQTRKDALLRTPLVSIIVHEDTNMIEFKGNAAATVKYIKEDAGQQD